MRLDGCDRHPIAARVLCADDDSMVRRTLSKVLAMAGCEVTAVENGSRAWELLQTSDFDLLVTDYEMPEMNGATLASRVRGQKPGLPIIVTSGFAELDAVFERLALEDVIRIPKPYTAERMLNSVREALANHAQEVTQEATVCQA